MTKTLKLMLTGSLFCLAALGITLVPAADTCAIDAECTTITKSGTFGPVTGNSIDCPWAEKDARMQISAQMGSFCGSDLICDSHISFSSCTYTGGGNYRVTATGWAECGSIF